MCWACVLKHLKHFLVEFPRVAAAKCWAGAIWFLFMSFFMRLVNASITFSHCMAIYRVWKQKWIVFVHGIWFKRPTRTDLLCIRTQAFALSVPHLQLFSFLFFYKNWKRQRLETFCEFQGSFNSLMILRSLVVYSPVIVFLNQHLWV